MNNKEYAAKLEEVAQKVERGEYFSALDQAILATNDKLGVKRSPNPEQLDPQEVLHHVLEEMRSLLLASSYGQELEACGANRLPISLLPAGEVNAMAVAPDGTSIVVVESGLHGWLILLNRLVLRSCEKGCDKGKRRDEFNAAVGPWTRHWLLRGGDEGKESLEAVLSLQDLFIRTCAEPLGFIMSAQLTDWQLLWILAHDMAHVALGHVARAPTASRQVVGIPDGVRIYTPDQQMEIEADLRATAYVLEVFRTLE